MDTGYWWGKKGSTFISLEGVRSVDVINPNNIFRKHGKGRVIYEDGTVIKVPMVFAETLIRELRKANSKDTAP